MPGISRRPRPWMGRVLRASAGGTAWLVRGARTRPDVTAALLALLMFIIGWSTISQSHAVTASVMPLPGGHVGGAAPHREAGSLRRPGGEHGRRTRVDPAAAPAGAPMPWPVVHFLVLLVVILAATVLAELRLVAAVLAGSVLLFLVAMPTGMKARGLGAAIIVAFGLLARWLLLSRRQLAEQEEEAEVERARRAVVEERSRIARELHDVVAHHMSMVVVQAQTAPYRVADLTPEAKGEFVAIEESARAALQEVRGVLGVLREDGAQAQTAPQPTLADLPAPPGGGPLGGHGSRVAPRPGPRRLPTGHRVGPAPRRPRVPRQRQPPLARRRRAGRPRARPPGRRSGRCPAHGGDLPFVHGGQHGAGRRTGHPGHAHPGGGRRWHPHRRADRRGWLRGDRERAARRPTAAGRVGA
uniref:Histidine kinase dimerization/phosphoacceptor domain-containing protein n=1 Tax=Janibacter limosus TaxID=53458 RepID=A0AC61U6V3_9MICO|nr:histidine kinase dimerization/phosphoacceptor domain-containing protein [Janibacter limosus]